MGGSSQPTTTVQTQTKDPWSGAIPYITQALGQAQSLYQTGTGYQPYAGPTQAALDPGLAGALGNIYGIAQSTLTGTPGIQAAENLANTVIGSQGITPGISTALGGINQIAANTGNQNPYLQDILNTQGRQIADRVNSSMSGAGRYGSGQHADVLTRALAESADPVLAQDYQQRQQTALAANQAAAGIYGQGLQQAGQYAQLVPTLDAQRYVPAQMAAQVGEFYQNRAQNDLAAQIALANAQQAYPWEQLQRYNATIGGVGSTGGTTISAIPIQQPSALQSLFGGALAGGGIGSAFGPMGAGAGAIGGGLLSLLMR